MAKAALEELTSRTPLDLESTVEALNDTMVAAAADLEIRIGGQPTYQELMDQANVALIDINLSYEELTRRLKQTLREKDELARQLQAKNEQLRHLAMTDPLTNVANRRYFTQTLEAMRDAAEDAGDAMSMVMIDIDHFKKVNDQHGHNVGDEVLREVCKRISAVLRPHDLVGRLGGEEFGVLLPRCSKAQGRAVAARLRQAIRREPVRTSEGIEVQVTASFGGCTTIVPDLPDSDAILKRADDSLYASKRNGRDRVTWAAGGSRELRRAVS